MTFCEKAILLSIVAHALGVFFLQCLPVELVMEAHGSTRCLKKGASVRAFFEMNKHPHGYRFVRLYDNLRGENLPTIGLSAGWVPATVAEEYNGTGDVLVKWHGSFDDPVGNGSRIVSQSFDENSVRIHRGHGIDLPQTGWLTAAGEDPGF